jgi:hypothetical protein
MTLAQRMLAAANTIDELNTRYDFGEHMPWGSGSLRHEALIVQSEEEPRQGTGMTDIIERAEAELSARSVPHWDFDFGVVRELIAELKAARAENDSLQELNNNQANLLTEAAERLGDARAEVDRLLKFIEELTPAKLRAIDEGRA